MSRKKPSKSNKSTGKGSLLAVEKAKYQAAYKLKKYSEAIQIGEKVVTMAPTNPLGWELIANASGRLGKLKDAAAAMDKTIALGSDNVGSRLKRAQYHILAGQAAQVIHELEKIAQDNSDNHTILIWLSRGYHALGKNQQALEWNDIAYKKYPNDPDVLNWRARILEQLKKPSEAMRILETLIKVSPKYPGANNHLATLLTKEGEYESAEKYFFKELEASDNSNQVFCNLLVSMHYNPKYSNQELVDFAKQLDEKYTANSVIERAKTTLNPTKKLKVGLLSGGFRTHPVGQMILPALQELSLKEFELIAYSTTQVTDGITHSLAKLMSEWKVVDGLSDKELDSLIRSDNIDILIDMNGAGDGCRYAVLAAEPAPIIVKWVGTLINTTGLKSVDYLLSDSIETPFGVDDDYVEKLIRLPDDYVCYHIPSYIPKITPLPALKNRYITFGCLNNPAKLSPPMLHEWSKLMHEVPDSKLLLKGVEFERENYRHRIANILAQSGISEERLIFEGPAPHAEFIATYQRIDIALDTWPYSGGLTTCESLIMGVPVVTMVGPTFAGRHSASHLVNVGLPELVTDTWDGFRQRVKELASDLPNLAVIRAALRTIMMESPVCDGQRFAKHFTTVLRGTWQRHCEGKPPEALTFNKEGEAWFVDEEKLVELIEVNEESIGAADFKWDLDRPITIIDNGAILARHPSFANWMATDNFAVITFDPGSLLTEKAKEMTQLGEWHHHAHATLGNGQDATLYATLEPELTGTLKPISAEKLFIEQQKRLQVLTQLPISTLKLNDIEGLPSVDFLVLDDLNDAVAVLENGDQYLKDTLLVQVRIAFQTTHESQPNFTELKEWADRTDFRVYTLKNLNYYSHFPEKIAVERDVGSELISADIILLPTQKRMRALDNQQRTILSLLLTEIYNIYDISYQLLAEIDSHIAERYLNKFLAIPALVKEKVVANRQNPKENTDQIYSSMLEPISNRELAISELKNALGSRKLVFLDTGSMANHGIVQSGQKRLFDILNDAGCPAEFIDSREVTPQRLIEMASSKDHVLYGANRYYDMTVNISGYESHNIFQTFNSAVVGTINDHPYATFMLDRIAKAPTTGLFLARASFRAELEFMRPDLQYVFGNQIETVNRPYLDCDKPHAERDIDILVPMNLAYVVNSDKLHANLMATAKSYGNEYKQLMDNVLNQFTDFSSSLLDIFREAYREIFRQEWTIQLPWSQDDVRLLRLLSQLDDVVRANKRLDALHVLSRFDSSARVVILAPTSMQELLYRKMGAKNVLNWQFIGTQSFEALQALYTRARYVLNVFPTYHDWLHERVRGAAAAGCALITNRNERASQMFTHGESVLFFENQGSEELYSSNTQISEKIGIAGRVLLQNELVSGDDGIGRMFSACADYLNRLNSFTKRVSPPEENSTLITLPTAPHMSEKERNLFKKELDKASSYFEFGSGGSTVWAVNKGLLVRGVESDKSWVNTLKNQLGEKCQLNFVDIGPTGDWGMPTSNHFADQFKNYSRSILSATEPFDLILVDGRFRVACTMATILHIIRTSHSSYNQRIFIHDFWNRPFYHVVLDFLETVERVDTAGVFVVKSGVSEEKVKSLYHHYIKDIR